MKCPHCLHAISPKLDNTNIISNPSKGNRWDVINYICPNCGNDVISGTTVPCKPNLDNAPLMIPAGIATY